MRTFKDNAGRTWSVTLNVLQMKRIRAHLGIDLVNVITLDAGGKGKVDLVDRIANDPCLLVDILWVLVEEQAKAINVTDEQFGAALAGESIENATRAFLDALGELCRDEFGTILEIVAGLPFFARRLRESAKWREKYVYPYGRTQRHKGRAAPGSFGRAIASFEFLGDPPPSSGEMEES